MAKTISLNFSGYWLEVDKAGVPARSGVYLVYVCIYNEPMNTVALKKLIYIGEVGDARDRISDHEKWPEWRGQAPQGSQICFSLAEVTGPDRERAEAALIFHHKPPCNDEYVDSFPFEDTTVRSKGKCTLITSPITVPQTPPKERGGG